MSYLRIQNIGKAYKRYHKRWHRMAEWLGMKPRHELRWVLKNISFDVVPGEAVGIIGVNGAGKSTLLKIITGTTKSSNGTVETGGRISALLELGMGFHPEFTGRQNAYMGAQIQGLKISEVDNIIEKIKEFSEIGDYFDQPVRTYSSGMQVRLAFSVATCVRPQILIVDEALSVGDAYFQHKSFNRIREFRTEGTTLLFVSHDRNAIQSLCDRAILLEHGFLIKDGNPEEVMDYYNAIIAEKENATVKVKRLEDGRAQTVSGTGKAVVSNIAILDQSGNRVEVVDVGQVVTLHIEVIVHTWIKRLICGYGIKDRLGQVMYGTNTDLKKQELLNVPGGSHIIFDIVFPVNLGVGSYSVQTALCSTDTHLVDNYEWRDLALVFNVVNISKTHFAGCVWIDPEIRISSL